MLKLRNSLTKNIEDLKPIKEGHVGLYTCGPTVYDHVHIGNLRTYIFEDTLRRVLKLNGYQVEHVMNLTDVDDKTIARSHERYPNDEPKTALKKLTAEYEKVFLEDTAKVGIDFTESKIVRATEHIESMQKLIATIPNRYLEADGVYFDITKYKDYGIFSQLDQSHTHHRIHNDEYDKEHVADFALWKAKKGNEPSWPFELDGTNIEGRPGWHIECSAMATKYLGQPFDLHTGGVDLKFPHHENEIAQSKAASGKDLAKIFVHGEHLLVGGKKMAKSAKNFYTLQHIEKKGFDPLAFRLLVLQAHYRSQLNFTWESLDAAQRFLQRLFVAADRQFQPSTVKSNKYVSDWLMQGQRSAMAFMNDDLNTPKSIAWLGELTDFIDSEPIDSSHILKLKKTLSFFDDMFGLGLSKRLDISKAQASIITQREAARQAKDYKKADKLRTELEQQGIGLNDNQFGVTWYRLLGR